MPVEYTFHEDEWLVEVRYAGPVSLPEIRDCLMEMVNAGLFRKPLRLLGDVTGIQPKFSVNEMVQHQEWRKQLPRFGRMAVVASTPFEYGLARQFIMATNQAGGSEMEVFRTLRDARNWLGLR